jgi:ABC-type lipoprotein export system ATPase subunit
MSDRNVSVIVDKISKNYVMESSVVKVFDNFSLSASRGETVAVTGPSGSGKTTLLNLIGGLDLPDSGVITVDGENIANLAESELADYRNRKVGFVFQEHLLLPQCTLLENVLIPVLPAVSGISSEEKEGRALMLLERVGLKERCGHFPRQLSGGEKQRAALVRALINEPSIILADEPTGALDRKNSENLVELLKELNLEFGVTLILATHSEELASIMNIHIELDH